VLTFFYCGESTGWGNGKRKEKEKKRNKASELTAEAQGLLKRRVDPVNGARKGQDVREARRGSRLLAVRLGDDGLAEEPRRRRVQRRRRLMLLLPVLVYTGLLGVGARRRVAAVAVVGTPMHVVHG